MIGHRHPSLPARLALLLLAPLTGCTVAHGPEGEISSGVYELTIRSVRDACAPRRLSGEVGPVGVVSVDGLLSVPVPEQADDAVSALTRRVTLLEAEGFHYEQTATLEACATARTDGAWTVTDRRAGRFVVEHLRQYEGLAGCAPMAEVPEADCRAVRELEFRLVTTCEAPCGLSWTAGAGTVCLCE